MENATGEGVTKDEYERLRDERDKYVKIVDEGRTGQKYHELAVHRLDGIRKQLKDAHREQNRRQV